MKQQYKALIVSVLVLVAVVCVLISKNSSEAGPADSTKALSVQIDGQPARYFGNEATGDLNGDGIADSAFLVVSEPGGSGTFYYAIAALKTSGGYKLTNPVLIGDRISPQSTEIQSGEIHVNYAERKAGEPMTTPPSQGAVLLLKVNSAGTLEGLMK